ncbi:MAG: YggT family protein [Nitrospira sp.]|nr:YggT family protein [bacterium]MBL7049061.1 YggT family protein [Nitrospira sp.]
MFIFGDIFIGLATILDTVLGLYKWVVIISALLSWVSPDPYNPIVKFLYSITEPVYRPIRSFIGGRLGAIDISPIIVILAILFLQVTLVNILRKTGFALGGG